MKASRPGEVLVIGAGPSGATIARVLAEKGYPVSVIEKAAEPGGLCHTHRDPRTGVMVHTHGPHIFHSDDADLLAVGPDKTDLRHPDAVVDAWFFADVAPPYCT